MNPTDAGGRTPMYVPSLVPSAAPAATGRIMDDAQIQSAIDELQAAKVASGPSGMEVPRALVQTVVNYAAMFETIQAMPLEQLTADMKQFLEVMADAQRMADKVRSSIDLPNMVPQSDQSVQMRTFIHLFQRMMTMVNRTATTLNTEAVRGQAETTEKAADEMRAAAKADYTGKMWQAGASIAQGVVSTGMGMKAAKANFEARSVDMQISQNDRQLKSMDRMEARGAPQPGDPLRRMAIDQEQPGLEVRSRDLHHDGDRYRVGGENVQHGMQGIAGMVAASFTLQADRSRAAAKELEAVGALQGDLAQSAKQLAQDLKQMMSSNQQALRSLDEANLRTEHEMLKFNV